MRRRATAVLVGALLLAGCASTSETRGYENVWIGDSEGPPAPTIVVPAETVPDIVVWTPPTVGTAPPTTAFDSSSWAEKDAVERPVLSLFSEDGTIGLKADDIERGDELIDTLEKVTNSLPFEGPVTVGIVSSRPVSDGACVDSGNTAPCASVLWVVRSQGKVVSAPLTVVIVKDGGSWKISARDTCGVMMYFRTPCPLKFPPSPNELKLGAPNTTKP